MRRLLPALLFALATSTGLAAQTPAQLQQLQDEAVQRGKEYLRINTINPPGNEVASMEWFARIFAREGIPFDTASPAPGRGNIWARLKGGSEPALLLLHHMDVVPADPKYWDVDPLSGETRNGDLYGRGALDTKLLGVTHLQTFLALHRFKVPLNRDVIFMATADEEAGGAFGAGWIVQNRPDAFAGAGFVLNEGGGGSVDGTRQQVGIEVTQKVPLWLKLVATGNPGHGSAPQVSTAVTRLVRALERLRTYEFAPRIVPAVDAYFKGLAPNVGPAWRAAFENMAATIQNPLALLTLQADAPGFAALTRNTCSITMLEGSSKINVVPTEASAQIDCRLLPDQDPAAFLAELRQVLNEPAIRIEQLMGFSPAVSPTNNAVYQAMVDVTKQHFPQAAVIPEVARGFTDSHFFRDLGIHSYGYAPFLVPVDQEGGLHGNNERLSEANLRRGTGIMLEIVRRIAERRVAGDE